MAQAVASCFKAADGLLESLFIIFTNTHYLTYGAHLGAQVILNAFEFFKGPAGKLDYNVIAAGNVFVQSSVLSAGDVL